MDVKQSCPKCHWEGAGAACSVCPQCGSGLAISAFAGEAESLSVSDAVNATLLRGDGTVAAERTHETRVDGEVRSAIDAGGPQRISRVERNRPSTLVEEERFAVAFVRAWNARNGTTYVLRPKPVEDGEFTDRFVLDENGEEVLLLQIRKLDDDVAKALGRERKFEGERSSSDLAAAITSAINKKALADPAEKARHELLLVAQHPLGEIIARELTAMKFDLGGYRAVWIQGYDDDPFMLVGQ